jgi:hypothetical protein
MKQTAVEWLIEELEQSILITSSVKTKIKQANKMEKQVNAETWNNAIDAQLKDKWESFEQYYNEIFKNI